MFGFLKLYCSLAIKGMFTTELGLFWKNWFLKYFTRASKRYSFPSYTTNESQSTLHFLPSLFLKYFFSDTNITLWLFKKRLTVISDTTVIRFLCAHRFPNCPGFERRSEVKLLQIQNLFVYRTLNRTFTYNEALGNVLIAILLFVLSILRKDIVTCFVCTKLRLSLGVNFTKFLDASYVSLDDSLLLRLIWKMKLFGKRHYNRRNHMQYNSLMLAKSALFITELGLVVPGLHVNTPIFSRFGQNGSQGVKVFE